MLKSLEYKFYCTINIHNNVNLFSNKKDTIKAANFQSMYTRSIQSKIEALLNTIRHKGLKKHIIYLASIRRCIWLDFVKIHMRCDRRCAVTASTMGFGRLLAGVTLTMRWNAFYSLACCLPSLLCGYMPPCSKIIMYLLSPYSNIV